MSMTLRILSAWRAPRQVMRGLLAAGPREDRALATLIAACAVMFIAQWPALSREAHLEPDIPLQARLSGALMATLFIVPLLAYAMAGLVHLVARVMGGRGTWYTARLALFWSLLAIAPLTLFQGLVMGFLGPGPAATATGLVVLVGFLFQWINAIIVTESSDNTQ
jgi:hypothetical protein